MSEPQKTEHHNLITENKTMLMTVLSGILNSLMLLFFGQTVTHHTGNLTKLAHGIMRGETQVILMMLALVVSYFLGAMLSGLIFSEQTALRRRRYGVLMIAIGFVLIMSAMIFGENSILAPLLALASGIQNGMYITYKGGLMRSTHMTGYLSDAGFLLSRLLRDKNEKADRFLLVLFHLFAFVIGGIVGVLLHPLGIHLSLLIAGLLYLLVGIGFVYQGVQPYMKGM